MSARLALDLDHDAIRLLSQQSDGWVVEGLAELDSADLTAKLTALRQRAEDLAGPDPAVLLVLPRSQVLYTSFEGLEDPERDVGPLLEGMTPYDVHEITWDQVTADGETRVAAIALETLDEALAFAASSRFRVVGLTTEPPEDAFPRLPVFQRLPGFLRASDTKRALVLEPAEPPARKAVAFSDQRGADYGPKAGALTLAAAVRTRDAASKIPSQVARVAALVPKPLLGAVVLGGAVALGAALWPEGDPDPFTKRGMDLSFTELPAAMVEGLEPPPVGAPPDPLANIEAVTSLRDAPAIVVPVVIGTSGVTADYFADEAPGEAFETFAALPALFGETRLPSQSAARPPKPASPAFPAVEPLGASRFARVPAPAPLPMPPESADRPEVAAIAAAELERFPPALPADAPAPVAPDRPAELATPALAAMAPSAGSAPTESRPPAGLPATRSDEAPGLRLASLPSEGTLSEALPDTAMALLPPTPDDRFDLGADGFVVATPEGTRTPGGVLAIAGAPAVVAPPRPGTAEEAARAVAEAAVEERPDDSAADVVVARANPNPDLVEFPPRARPASATDLEDQDPAAADAPDVPDAVIAEALEAQPEEQSPAAEPVLTASLLPRPRPARATAAPQAVAARAAPVAPTIPSRANVAREATIEDALPLGSLNLIGVYGSANDRRALVRLPTGRFVKLKVGDRIDGGQVAQIGPDRLLYQKGTRTLALEMPNT